MILNKNAFKPVETNVQRVLTTTFCYAKALSHMAQIGLSWALCAGGIGFIGAGISSPSKIGMDQTWVVT